MQSLEKSYDRYFDFPEGMIGVMADLFEDGETLVLKDVAIYPRDTEFVAVGARQVREILHHVEEEARQLGFAKIRITAERLSGASPRRLVDIGRGLH